MEVTGNDGLGNGMVAKVYDSRHTYHDRRDHEQDLIDSIGEDDLLPDELDPVGQWLQKTMVAHVRSDPAELEPADSLRSRRDR